MGETSLCPPKTHRPTMSQEDIYLSTNPKTNTHTGMSHENDTESKNEHMSSNARSNSGDINIEMLQNSGNLKLTKSVHTVANVWKIDNKDTGIYQCTTELYNSAQQM